MAGSSLKAPDIFISKVTNQKEKSLPGKEKTIRRSFLPCLRQFFLDHFFEHIETVAANVNGAIDDK